jgi:hypothetical protein
MFSEGQTIVQRGLDGDGEFASWYINLQTPVRRWWGGLDFRDHAPDVVVAADRTWRWKDSVSRPRAAPE